MKKGRKKSLVGLTIENWYSWFNLIDGDDSIVNCGLIVPPIWKKNNSYTTKKVRITIEEL